MKKLLTLLALALSLSGATIKETKSNEDVKIYVAPGGVVTEAVNVKGSTGGVSIRGTNTNDSAAAGYVGEYLSAVGSIGDGSGRRQILSLALTAGDWDVWGTALFFSLSADPSRVELAVNGSNTTVTTDMKLGGYMSIDPAGSGNLGGQTGVRRFSLSSSSTVYLMSEVTGANYSADAGLFARRIR